MICHHLTFWQRYWSKKNFVIYEPAFIHSALGLMLKLGCLICIIYETVILKVLLWTSRFIMLISNDNLKPHINCQPLSWSLSSSQAFAASWRDKLSRQPIAQEAQPESDISPLKFDRHYKDILETFHKFRWTPRKKIMTCINALFSAEC